MSQLLGVTSEYYDVYFTGDLNVSPYLKSMLRIHWYFMQLLVILHCTSFAWDSVQVDLQLSTRAYEHVSPENKRVFEAMQLDQYLQVVVLTLYDLYLHVPSTYELSTAEAPVHSVWAQLVHMLEDIGPKVNVSKNIWKLLYEMVRDHNAKNANFKAHT